MSEYRENFGALRERVHALEEELAAANRAAEEARTEATFHERSCETLRRQVEQLRPPRGTKLRLWIGGFVAGALVVGVVASASKPSRRRLQDLEELQKKCTVALETCRSLREDCDRLR